MPEFAGVCRGLLGFAGIYWGLLGFAGFTGVCCVYWGLLSLLGFSRFAAFSGVCWVCQLCRLCRGLPRLVFLCPRGRARAALLGLFRPKPPPSPRPHPASLPHKHQPLAFHPFLPAGFSQGPLGHAFPHPMVALGKYYRFQFPHSISGFGDKHPAGSALSVGSRGRAMALPCHPGHVVPRGALHQCHKPRWS